MPPKTQLTFAPAFLHLAWSNLAAQSAEQIALSAASLVAVLTFGMGTGGTGLLQAAQTLPFLLLSIPAGLLADRTSRLRLLAAAEALRAASLALILVLAGLGLLNLPFLALLGLVGAAGTVAYSAASYSSDWFGGHPWLWLPINVQRCHMSNLHSFAVIGPRCGCRPVGAAECLPRPLRLAHPVQHRLMGRQYPPQRGLPFVARLGDAFVHFLDPRRHLLGQAGQPLLQLLAVALQLGRPDRQDARKFGGSAGGWNARLQELDEWGQVGSRGAGHAWEGR